MSRRSSIDTTEPDYYFVGKQKRKGRAGLADGRASRPSKSTTPDRATHGHSQGHPSTIPPQKNEDPASNDPRTVTSNHDEAVRQQRQSMSQASSQTTTSRRSSIDSTETEYYVVKGGKGKGRADLADERASRPSEPTTPDRAEPGYSQAHPSNMPPQQYEDPASNDPQTVTSNHDEAVHHEAAATSNHDNLSTSAACPTTPEQHAPAESPATPSMKSWKTSIEDYTEDDLPDGSVSGAATSSNHNNLPSASDARSGNPVSDVGNTWARPYSASFTNDTVGDELLGNLVERVFRDMPIFDFLNDAFDIRDGEFQKTYEKIVDWKITGSENYKKELKAFRSAFQEKDEHSMYKPLVEIGNMFLEKADAEDKKCLEKSSNAEKNGSERPREIRLHHMDEKTLTGPDAVIMKPDIVLIPKSVQERVENAKAEEAKGEGKKSSKPKAGEEAESSGWVDIREVLAICEVKPGGAQATMRRQNPCVGPDSAEVQSTVSRATTQIRQSLGSAQASKVTVKSKEEPQQPQQRSADKGVRSSARIKAQSKGSKRSRSSASTGSNKRPRSNQAKTQGSTPRSGYAATVSHTSAGLGKTNKDPNDGSLGKAQLAKYTAGMLSARGDRPVAFCIRVNAGEITLSFYHRLALVEAKSFTLEENPEYFALFLLMFRRDPTSYGFSTDIGYCDPFNLQNPESMKMRAKIKDIGKRELDFTQLKYEERIASEFCLVGRGSVVHKAQLPGAGTVAVKVSWHSENRKPEVEFISAAKKILPENIAEVYGYAELEDGTPLETLLDKCERQGIYEKKNFRIIVMKYYEGISNITDPVEFWDLMIQAANCLHILYKELKLLHRDISIGNLAYYRDGNGKAIIVILDFDLATYAESEGHGSERRTGTAPFMAREVLDGFKEEYRHGLHHDLESIFYALIWQAVGYRRNKGPADGTDPLKTWRKGNYANMRAAKNSFILAEEDSFLDTCVKNEMMKYRLEKIRREYNIQTNTSIRETADRSILLNLAIREAVEAIERKAVEEGLSEKEMVSLSQKKRKELYSAARLRRPTCAISFRRWMKAVGVPIDERHRGCDCCETD